jgi:hypothetical protein
MAVTRRTATVALVHVLLAALALTAVTGWGTGADPALAGQHVTVPDHDPRLPNNPEEVALVRPPGRLVVDSTFVKHGASPNVLGELESKTLRDEGVVMVKALVTRENDLTQGVWQMSVRDSADPHAALRAIDDLYEAGGWTRATGPARGVTVRAQQPTKGQPYASYRAHYVRGPYLIRIEAYGTDLAQVDREFATLAKRQLAEWPPT